MGDLDSINNDSVVGDLGSELGQGFKLISLDETVQELCKTLLLWPKRAVLVSSEGYIVGFVSSREVLRKISEKSNLLECTISDIMDPNIYKININKNLREAIGEITSEDPMATVVVDDEGRFKGYFSPALYQKAIAKVGLY